MRNDEWSLNWDRGSIVVQEIAAMAEYRFDLADGRSVAPLVAPPWSVERPSADVPPSLQWMRGEWPCVPFCSSGEKTTAPAWREFSNMTPDGPLHGAPSNAAWSLIERSADALVLRFENTADSPIAWLEREIRPVQGEATVECVLRIMPRTAVSLPVGVHPVVRLPSTPGALSLRPGAFRFGLTCPYEMEPGGSRAGMDRWFTDITHVEADNGDFVDFSRLPFEGAWEDALQLCGTDGRFDIDNLEERYTLSLRWDPASFPSCLLWISNGGNSSAPWNNRHMALGVEPVCSAVGFGNAASAADNPIRRAGEPTTIDFEAGRLWETRYSLSVSALTA